MKTKSVNLLYIAITAIIFIVGLYFLVWERYSMGDIDAAGAYVCMVSMISCIVPLTTKNIAFAKKLTLGICAATILSLFFLWFNDDFSLTYEGLHVFIMMPAIAIVFTGFYFSLKKKQKQQARNNETK